jgi:predicted N-acetyltransferase YhbS
MTHLTFREATAPDIAGLHPLIESAYRGDSAKQGWTHEADLLDGQRTDADELAAIISDETRFLILAEQDGSVVGCVAISDQGEGLSYLGMLTVAPTLQAGGLGRQLIAIAEDTARTRFKATRMEMTVIHQRAELIAYYERRGYALTGETRPFPVDDPRFGLPKAELGFVVLEKAL